MGTDNADIFGQELIFKSEYTDMKGNIFRSHPSYRTEAPWHDWAMIRWIDNRDNNRREDIVPARIFAFFEITEEMIVPGSSTSSGIWMVVSSLCYDPCSSFDTIERMEGYQESYFNSISIATKWKIDRDIPGIHKFWIVNTENIVDTAYVLPDIDKECNLSRDYVIVVKKKKEWKDFFIRDRDRLRDLSLEESISDCESL